MRRNIVINKPSYFIVLNDNRIAGTFNENAHICLTPANELKVLNGHATDAADIKERYQIARTIRGQGGATGTIRLNNNWIILNAAASDIGWGQPPAARKVIPAAQVDRRPRCIIDALSASDSLTRCCPRGAVIGISTIRREVIRGAARNLSDRIYRPNHHCKRNETAHHARELAGDPSLNAGFGGYAAAFGHLSVGELFGRHD